jgi:hypothetical protein
MSRFPLAMLLVLLATGGTRANPPVASYIFPAGGQRGTAVKFKVGGLFLHERCGFEMLGPGVKADAHLLRTKTLWFEGPILPLPDSQQADDYPKDMAGQVAIEPNALAGLRHWRLWTSQGATPAMKFVVGDLPEMVEDEIDGDPVPVAVKLPITINGRIFPRADVDVWSFQARKGQTILGEVDAARLGSPLQARLEVRDSDGRALAENAPRLGPDPAVRFTAPADGTYQVRVHDIRFQGGQAFVYRLTITADPHVDRFYPLGGRRGSTVNLDLAGQNLPKAPVPVALPAVPNTEWAYQFDFGGKKSNRILLELDDLPEHLEAEPNDRPNQAKPVALPAVFNGRIDTPGDIDCFSWTAKKGETYVFDLRAARLGSPLDGVLTVRDAAGKQLARAEAAPLDPTLTFTVSADGTYCVEVRDRFRSRGGPEFAYRLRADRPPAPDFRLSLQADVVTLPRKGQAVLKVTAKRIGGFKEPIALAIHGLPSGVKVAPVTLGPGQTAVDLRFTADATAAIKVSHLSVEGSAKLGSTMVKRTARLATPRGAPELADVLLAVALPTPFQIKGEYIMGFAPRGTLQKRVYKIERGGFTGPIEISLADRQMRHLQGVTGSTIVVPPGAGEFTYTIALPPWMEVGRTSRACVMGVGVVTEPDGSRHVVSFSSVNQNEQMVAVVGPGQLALELQRTSLTIAPKQTLQVPVQIKRGRGLKGEVRLELVVPQHIQGIAGAGLIRADQEPGTLTIQVAQTLRGPFTMPLIVRATIVHMGQPSVAEASLEIQLAE